MSALSPPGFPMGTAFPTTNLWVGMPWYRPDLGRWARWDGTRWLSAPVPAPITTGVLAFSNAGQAGVFGVPADAALYLLRWDLRYKIKTTNNSTNYHTVRLRKFDGTTTTDLVVFDTHLDAPNVWLPFATSTFTVNPLATTDQYVEIIVDSFVGAPGNLNLDSYLEIAKVLT